MRIIRTKKRHIPFSFPNFPSSSSLDFISQTAEKALNAKIETEGRRTQEQLRKEKKKSRISLSLFCTNTVSSNQLAELLTIWTEKKKEEEEEMTMRVEKCRKLAIYGNPMRIRVLNHRRFLHEGPDTIEELMDRHIAKKEKIYDSDEEELSLRRRLTSTRREALSLYRDIFRATRFFIWPDSRGNLWRDVLRENARREFEESKYEKDPEVITKLLIGGRDAVESALEKLVEKQKQQIAQKQKDGDRP